MSVQTSFPKERNLIAIAGNILWRLHLMGRLIAIKQCWLPEAYSILWADSSETFSAFLGRLQCPPWLRFSSILQLLASFVCKCKMAWLRLFYGHLLFWSYCIISHLVLSKFQVEKNQATSPCFLTACIRFLILKSTHFFFLLNLSMPNSIQTFDPFVFMGYFH